MRPTLAVLNQVNRGRVDSGNDRQRVCRDAKTQCFANMDDLFLRQFVSRMFFAAKVNQSGRPSMSRIVCKGEPFKVLGAIVKFVAVNVIDRQFRRVPRHESPSDQAMHEHFWAFVISQTRHNVIAAFADPWRKLALWGVGLKHLFLSFADAFYGVCSSGRPNAAIFFDKPNDAFFLDGDSVHGVHRLVGQS